MGMRNKLLPNKTVLLGKRIKLIPSNTDLLGKKINFKQTKRFCLATKFNSKLQISLIGSLLMGSIININESKFFNFKVDI